MDPNEGPGRETGGRRRLNGLAGLSIARPRAVLAAWVVAIAALGIFGTGVEDRLTQSIFVIPGTETERAVDLSRQEFGESVFVPVLLEGPPRQVERQGRVLAEKLSSQPDTRVLSPWNEGPGSERLRPRPDAAMVVAAVDRPFEQIFDETADEVRTLVDGTVAEPVQARITGMPVIGNAIKDETYSSAREAERLAIPILIVVLLLVFRAPIAALIPGITGLAAVLASAGVIWALAGEVAIDPLAISLASMMGLALGVDYSLLIVTRFREELAASHAAGGEPDAGAAARAAMGTAGRTVAFAGGALAVAMVVGMLIAPGALLLSAAIGVLTSTVLSVGSAFLAIPAALTLLGGNIDRWHLGPRGAGAPRWLAIPRRALARPGLAALAIALPLLLLSQPAFGLDTGPPDVGQLPADSRERQDYERVAEVMGPGWAAPFEVLVVAERGTITTPQRLAALERWQRHLRGVEGVRRVSGPGALADESREARRVLDSLERGAEALERLTRGMRRAEGAVERLVSSGAGAADAAGQLAEGGMTAASASGTISAHLEAAAGGAELIREALATVQDGVGVLRDRVRRGREALPELIRAIGLAKDKTRFDLFSAINLIAFNIRHEAGEIQDVVRPPAQSAAAHLDDALAELDAMGVGKTDPRYPALRDAIAAAYLDVTGVDPSSGTRPDPDYEGLDRELELIRSGLLEHAETTDRLGEAVRELAAGLARAQRAIRRLRDGLDRLDEGLATLNEGLSRIERAAVGMRSGLRRLGEGSVRLERGLEELSRAIEQLSEGLSAGRERAGALVLGLERAAGGAEGLQKSGERALAGQEGFAGLFESGYFLLAGIEQGSEDAREAARLSVNVPFGGEAGRVLVVPSTGPNDEATRELRDELSRRADRLGDEIGAETAVGGTAAALAEYDEITSERLLWLILALALVSYVVLVPIFRSLVLPLIAVALNLISVGAAFGALTLLFQGSDPVLGGPGYIDAVSVSAIYTVIYGLSLDYQVFLILRMREGRLRGADTPAAIAYGLERTAAVVTGAAAIMVAVFMAFALTDITGTRQFGVGLAIAVILDATLVRLLLLPAAMRIAGDACWRLPGGLERRLGRNEPAR